MREIYRDKIGLTEKYHSDGDDTRDTNPSLDILESLKSSSLENSSVSNKALESTSSLTLR